MLTFDIMSQLRCRGCRCILESSNTMNNEEFTSKFPDIKACNNCGNAYFKEKARLLKLLSSDESTVNTYTILNELINYCKEAISMDDGKDLFEITSKIYIQYVDKNKKTKFPRGLVMIRKKLREAEVIGFIPDQTDPSYVSEIESRIKILVIQYELENMRLKDCVDRIVF